MSLSFNDLDEALEVFNEMTDRFPSLPEAYLGRAMAWSGLKKYKKALKDHDKVLDLNPDNPLFYYYRGETKSLMGDQAGACSDWEQFRQFLLKNEDYLWDYLEQSFFLYFDCNYYCKP